MIDLLLGVYHRKEAAVNVKTYKIGREFDRLFLGHSGGIAKKRGSSGRKGLFEGKTSVHRTRAEREKDRDCRKNRKPCATGRKIVTKETQEGCLSFSIKSFSALFKGRKTCSSLSKRLFRQAAACQNVLSAGWGMENQGRGGRQVSRWTRAGASSRWVNSMPSPCSISSSSSRTPERASASERWEKVVRRILGRAA